MLRIKWVFCLVLVLLVACSSQNGQQSTSNNFNQLKAAKTRVSLGLTYLKNGNYSQAKFNLDKAMEFAPRSADVNFAMAYYYQKVGEIEQAENAYQFAMDLEPKNADITNSYGAFLCQNGDYEKAKVYFLKAVNTSNYISSAETYENLALCSQSSGHPKDAIEYLRSAVNHQPGRGNSLFLLANSLIETEQWQEARDVLRRYEKVAQVSPQSLLMAIKIENGSGNYAEAKAFRDMLIKVYPTHPEVLALLKEKPEDVKPKKVLKVIKAPTRGKVEPVQQEYNTSAIAVPEVEKAVVKETIVNNEPKQVMDSTHKQVADTNTDPVDQIKVAEQVEEKSEAKLLVQESEIKKYHLVTKGENLYRISLMYNIRMQRLIEWNNLSDASAIYNGMKLNIVAPNSDE
ncbi:type IV pilus biogenesis/stability protein PilW [Paraglaciecola aquimarina]|uniref:Type IV pilus biogenesis/stability protein PilW n=1 Tax=Paraglaciecola algarum TaxID=3050085 RepID=A0ABS9D0X0_9ALTE|nr:type IV pilus biogenesis/stability protein PilW [Paraglaciecola sp. G1-23]MCF2946574.1 type IV pilus biogenesis/stability protein PilW [Paraglaciecola sp. G1-23]